MCQRAQSQNQVVSQLAAWREGWPSADPPFSVFGPPVWTLFCFAKIANFSETEKMCIFASRKAFPFLTLTFI